MNKDNLKHIKKHESNVRVRIADLPELIRPDFFAFERHYNDGTCQILTTKSKIYEHHFENRNPLVEMPLPKNEKCDFGDRVGVEAEYLGKRQDSRSRDEKDVFGLKYIYIYRKYDYDMESFDSFYWVYKEDDYEKIFYKIANSTDVLENFPHILLRAFSPILRKKKGLIDMPNEMLENWDFLTQNIVPPTN